MAWSPITRWRWRQLSLPPAVWRGTRAPSLLASGRRSPTWCKVRPCSILVSLFHASQPLPAGLATPGDMKLRLIPILSDMHHNISTATQVGGAQGVGGALVAGIEVILQHFSCVRFVSCVCSCCLRTLPSPSSPPPSTPSHPLPKQPESTSQIR